MRGKNFLIIAASIGSGHVKAAEAIAEALKIKEPNASITIIDFTEWGISWATAFMKATYLMMLRVVPDLYKLMYKFTGGKAGGLSVQSLISFITKRDIAALVKKYKPDALICTHPFPAGAASWFKKSHPDSFLFGTLITDYSVHQMWIYQNVDCYFVAREAMKTDLLSAGLPQEQIFVTGIPISNRFLRQGNRLQTLEHFKLRSDQPVVLIMGGGLGLGGVEAALIKLEKIERSLQILVIAGKNAKLKKRVETAANYSHHKILVWGYCAEVPEMMSIASLLISKPGALTVTEALASELPMILHDPIPGPETDNAAYASRRGAALWARTDDKLEEAVNLAINESDQLGKMKEMAHKYKRPYAAEEIAELIFKELKKK